MRYNEGKRKRRKEGSRERVLDEEAGTLASLAVRRGCSLLAKSEIVCRTYLYHSRYYMLCQASEEDLKPRLQQLHTGTSRTVRACETGYHNQTSVHNEKLTETAVVQELLACSFDETPRENSNYLSVNGTDSIGKSAYCFQPVGG